MLSLEKLNMFCNVRFGISSCITLDQVVIQPLFTIIQPLGLDTKFLAKNAAWDSHVALNLAENFAQCKGSHSKTIFFRQQKLSELRQMC